MEEIRVYSGFLGMERNKQAGHSMEMKPEARVACQVMLAVLFTALFITAITFAVQAFQPHAQPCLQCPFDWIRYRGKCYYFSEAEGNWTSGQENCSALGASLAMLDSTEDLSFVMRYKGISEYWIGLLREDEEQPWQWVNSSPLSHVFQIRGGGLCAYLDDNGLSSSHCSTERSWICNKHETQSSGKGNRMRRPPNLCVSSLGAAGRPSHSQISGAPQGHERKSQKDFEIPGQGVIGVSRDQQGVSGTRQPSGIHMR